MAIKERRTKILFSLVLFSNEVFDDLVFTPLIEEVFDISLNPKTKATISKLVKEDIIYKKEGNGPNTVPSYGITERGFYIICLEFPFFRYVRDQWDGKWRILSYEIPEKKRDLRDRLRREVAGWGLGPWHRSFWITPHPIISDLKNLLSSREEEKYVQAFESDHVFGDRGILIEKVWEISLLEKQYRDMFKKWHDILSSNSDKEKKLKRIVSLYIDILRKDPGLPKELAGENWIAFEAFKLFKEIRNILLAS